MTYLRRSCIAARITLAAILTACSVDVALACRDVTERKGFGELTVAEVKPGRQRVHFAKPECAPGKPGDCAMKAYVMPGDLVLVGEVFDVSACAIYVDAKGRTTEGLLPNERLQAPRKPIAATAAALVGNWSRTEATIAIKAPRRDGALQVSGEATYGALDRDRVRRGAVNLGEIGFTAKPTANRIEDGWEARDTSACAVAMIALGPYMVVEDNRNCGGANVSFTGIYRRR